jgi:hypothetical protein
MFTRHQLTCQRAGCGRAFTATRSDALYCSRRCRRDKSPTTLAPPPVEDAAVVGDDLDAWRRVPGGYVIPPPDPRFTFTPDELGGL